ncbi:diguanylate cyclase [Rheinheimera sp. 4Y26]|uniref:tetratricopeptide repeat-containing diguanylate cyclase n=1 Tax=Rheinheimera sp. 4Y26 TaxID=2977811 RepID=UPI0021B1191D|nr:diguanylate cyclase [Rheinheimera sp. 4Y26]MCT6698060.1 diguanylate cyclase [Rheinheimera sp. 4Y26]
MKKFVLAVVCAQLLQPWLVSAQQQTTSGVKTDISVQTSVDPDFTARQLQLQQARQQGDLALADALATQYLTAAEQQADLLQMGQAYHELGNNAMARNDYPLAKQHLEQAVSLLTQNNEQNGDAKPLAAALRRLGMVYRYQSDYSTALDYVYRAMQIYQLLQDQAEIANSYGSVGTILEKMGQYEAALQAHQQELEYYARQGKSSDMASVLFNLANLNHKLGDPAKALQYYLQVMQLDLASGDKRNIAYSHNKLAFLYTDLGQLDKAGEHIRQALQLFAEIGAKRDLDWARTVEAKLALANGKPQQARQILDAVIQRATERQYLSLLVDAYELAATVALQQQDDAAAMVYINAGIAQAKQNHEQGREAKLQQMRVTLLLKKDDAPAALAALLAQKQLDDEIFNSKRAAAIAAIQAQTDYTSQQYQIERLQHEKDLQQARLEQQKLTRNFWIYGLLAGFVLLISLYRRYLQHRQNLALEHQVNVRTAELQQKNTELALAYQQLETISLTDKLTGLSNRHFLESHIDKELELCRRQWHDWQQHHNRLEAADRVSMPEHSELAVFLIDLDHFKQLNDQHGHHAGDDVLRQVKQRMQQVFRQTDYLVRWGGEEFVVVARQINRAEASQLASRFVTQVAATPFMLAAQQPLAVTCSVGFACYPLPLDKDPGRHFETLLKIADCCLYAAKHSGRNGWAGLTDISPDLPLLPAHLCAEKLQSWQQQGLLQLVHSFARLQWPPLARQ